MNNFPILPSGASLYGNYRTRTFSDIWGKAEDFSNEFMESPFPNEVGGGGNLSINNKLEFIYYLLYSRYGNSSIASSDETQFKFHLFSLIFQYGPTWLKELEIQKEIRNSTLEDFRLGSTNVINNAVNPSTAPTTQSLDELPFIENQNVSKTKRSKADGYALMLSLLKEDVTEKFLKRFQKLFLTIVQPERPLWYVTEED